MQRPWNKTGLTNQSCELPLFSAAYLSRWCGELRLSPPTNKRMIQWAVTYEMQKDEPALAHMVSISRCQSVGSDAWRMAGSRCVLCGHAIASTVVSYRECDACVRVGAALGQTDRGASASKGFFGYQGAHDRRPADSASVAVWPSSCGITKSEDVLYTVRSNNHSFTCIMAVKRGDALN